MSKLGWVVLCAASHARAQEYMQQEVQNIPEEVAAEFVDHGEDSDEADSFQQNRQQRVLDAERQFADILQQNINPYAATKAGGRGAGSFEPTSVEVPLTDYTRLRDRLKTLRQERLRSLGPAVVLGATEYRGEVKKNRVIFTTHRTSQPGVARAIQDGAARW